MLYNSLMTNTVQSVSSSKSVARTSRIPGAFAGVGAVRQVGGSLQVYRCNTCLREVVWAESKRTGRKYLCNVRVGAVGQRYYIGAEFHDCAKIMADDKAWEKLDEDARARF